MAVNNEKTIFKIYRLLYILPALILGCIMISTRKTAGEEIIDYRLSFTRVEILFLMIVHILTIELTIPLFKFAKKVYITSNRIFEFTDKIHWVFFIIISLQIIVTLTTENMTAIVETGVKQEWNRSVLTVVMNAFKISSIFPLYYVCCRGKNHKILYWANIFLYVIWQVICGWTMVFLIVGILEFYMRYKHKELKFVSTFPGVASAFIFGVGSVIYKFVWPLKNQIRYGFSLGSITILEAMEKLLSRFTNLPVSIIGLQNNAIISKLYIRQGIWNAEILAMFRTLVPSYLMPDKNFRPFANIVKQSVYLSIEPATGTGYNFFVREINLMSSDIACFLLWNIILIFLFLVVVSVLKGFKAGDENENILLYMFCIQVVTAGGDLESVFGYGYLGLIYMIPFLIIFGGLKIKKR